jgi:hypothetical protein
MSSSLQMSGSCRLGYWDFAGKYCRQTIFLAELEKTIHMLKVEGCSKFRVSQIRSSRVLRIRSSRKYRGRVQVQQVQQEVEKANRCAIAA